MAEPLPVTLLGGFLGAGKTTLLNRLLRTLSGRRVAVLVNDFGDLDIDAESVEAIEDDVTRLRGGCMCCAIRDSAVSCVLALAERDPPPEHVLIEASGASDVAALKQTFRDLERHQTVRIDGLVTLVDAERFDPRDRELGLLQRCQVQAADLVVVNKTDLVDDARRARVEAQVTELNPAARKWSTTRADVPEALLFGLPSVEGPAELAPDAEALLESRVLEVEAPVEGRALVEVLATLPATVFRAKGYVRLAERPDDEVRVQVVGARVHVQTVGRADASRPGARLVAIGRRGAVDWDFVQACLRRCAG